MSQSIPVMMQSAEFYEQHGQTAGVVCVAMSSLISLTSLVYLFAMKYQSLKILNSFSVLPFVLSLLASNLLKSVGIAIDFHWVDHGGVVADTTCTSQAVILQLSNLGIAIWTPIIGLALLNIAYLRIRLNRATTYASLLIGWVFAIVLVILGPAALQTKKKGPFFGVAGPWCGITDKYAMEHIFLEYFVLLLSALICMVIVMALKLQRSKPSSLSHLVENLHHMDDETMRRMTWIPIVYIGTVIMFVISRIVDTSGVKVPFGFIAFSTIVFNLAGFFNVIAIIYITNHRSPSSTYEWPAFLPQFTTKKPEQRFSLKTFRVTIDKVSSATRDDDMDGTKGNVYIAPDAWKTSAPKGRSY